MIWHKFRSCPGCSSFTPDEYNRSLGPMLPTEQTHRSGLRTVDATEDEYGH
jgi:hypothetical protein